MFLKRRSAGAGPTMYDVQQFKACFFDEEHSEPAAQDGQGCCSSDSECQLTRLSESSANLQSPTRSADDLEEFSRTESCSLQDQQQGDGASVKTHHHATQGLRPASTASLTLHGYHWGASTTTSSTVDSEAGSCTGYSSAVVRSGYGGSVLAFTPTPLAIPSPFVKTHSHRTPCSCCSDSTPLEAAAAPAAAVAIRATRNEDFGYESYLIPEIQLFDVQLARMLTAVSKAANTPPAQLLQALLNFAPEDYQDLVNALVESGCSCVYLIACHLHNLRTMAEEAIHDTAVFTPADDGKDAAVVAVPGTEGNFSAAAKLQKSSSDVGRKGKGGLGVGPQTSLACDVDPGVKTAQEALRASILDQYRRVVCRIVDTALLHLAPEGRLALLPSPPPPPPSAQQNGRGFSSRGHSNPFMRTRSTPIPASTPWAAPRVDSSQKSAVSYTSPTLPAPSQRTSAATAAMQRPSGPASEVANAAVPDPTLLCVAGARACVRLGGKSMPAHQVMASSSSVDPLMTASASSASAVHGRRLPALLSSDVGGVAPMPPAASMSGRATPVSTDYTAAGALHTEATIRQGQVHGQGLRLVATQPRSQGVVAPPQPLQQQRHTAALFRQQQQLRMLQQEQERQQQAQRLQQLQQQQVQLLEFFAVANAADGAAQGTPLLAGCLGVGGTAVQGLSAQPVSVVVEDSLSIVAAAAAQLVQAYGNATPLPTDALAALQWQLPTTGFRHSVGRNLAAHVRATNQQQQLMLLSQGGPLPTVVAGLTVGHTAAAAAAAASLPFATIKPCAGLQLPGTWMA